MTKYAVYYDDGLHGTKLEVFTSKAEAVKCFVEEAEKYKADPEGYTGLTPDEYHSDGPPDLELAIVDDEDECFLESLNVYTLDGGFDTDPSE